MGSVSILRSIPVYRNTGWAGGGEADTTLGLALEPFVRAFVVLDEWLKHIEAALVVVL